MARRNANGEGSIYRRKDGRYEAAVYLLTTTGVRKRIRVYGTSRHDVHTKLTEVKAKAAQGIPTPAEMWRLGEYLEHWLTHIVKANRRPATYTRYEAVVRLHLKPVLGHHYLARLSVPLVQQFVSGQLSAGTPVRTVQMMREVLRSALARAMREELLYRNVAAQVDVPKRERTHEVRPWSVQETKAFLAIAQPDPFYLAYLFLILYGLRRGEVLGLRWCDIDFEEGRLHISHQLQRINGQLTLAPLKTKAGRRTLALVDALAELLTTHAQRSNSEYLFINQHGHPFEPGSLLRAFQRLCVRHNLRRIRLHDLRHSQATLLKKLGVQPRDAQLILGHASVQTTQEIYQHGDEAAQRETLQQVERLFLRVPDGNGCRQNCRQNTKSQRIYRGDWWLGVRDSNSTEPIVDDPITGVMLVLKDRTKLWLLGRVAVKNSRQILFASPIHSPMEVWSFTKSWLGGQAHAW
jgi:integrase